MSLEYIASRQNNLVKELKKLAGSKRARSETGLVLSEGTHLLQTMLDAGVRPCVVAVTERLSSDPTTLSLLLACEGARSVSIADAVFDQIAPADSPVGLLALSPLKSSFMPPDTEIDTLVLESIQDPGNVGSLIRTAVAAGISQIVLSPGCADVWSPRCLRSAQGAQWLARVYTDVPLPVFLQSYQGEVTATVLENGQSLYRQNLIQPVAWLFGNEGQGLTEEIMTFARRRITIPMPGAMESLNVNAAAAVCLFEQVRQRQLA